MKEKIIVFMICLFVANSIIAQKKFTGVITYQISYNDSLVDSESGELPKQMQVAFRNGMSRTVLETNLGKQILLSDAEKQSVTILMDLGESEIAVINTKEEREKAMADLTPILLKYTNETKIIAGYSCKKVVVIQGDKSSEVFYTEELKIEKPNWQNEFKDINGVLLEYSKFSDDFETHYKASFVKKEKLKKKDFEIPSSYTIVSKETLTKAFEEKLKQD